MSRSWAIFDGAGQFGDLGIVMPIAAQLAEHRRAVTVELARDFLAAHLHQPLAFDLPSVGKRQMAVASLHSGCPFGFQHPVTDQKSQFRLARPLLRTCRTVL